MQNLIFKSPVHEENFEIAWGRIDEKNRTDKNRAIVYLLAWVETIRPGVIDLLLCYETVEVSHWHYLDKWQTRMTQNAIFLIHSFAINDFDYNLCVVDASHWNECFVRAFCIYYNTSYFEMEARWKGIIKMDAERKSQ